MDEMRYEEVEITETRPPNKNYFPSICVICMTVIWVTALIVMAVTGIK